MTKYKVVFIGSTGGAILSKVATHQFVCDMAFEALSDRDCGFIKVAESFGIHSLKFEAIDGLAFSDLIYKRYCGNENIIFLSFYTKLFKGVFLNANKGRIFNCHMSILPSFKGIRSFKDNIESSCRFIGSTIHLVDEDVDNGAAIIQAAIPIDRAIPDADNRHKVFLTQYYSTVQFLRWVYDGRLRLMPDGGFSLVDVKFSPSIFSPNLDSDFFEFIREDNQLN